jgi:hypothetical protein
VLGFEEEILERLVYLTVRVVPFILAAVFFSNIAIEYGFIKRMDFLVRPLRKAGNLSPGSSGVILTSLASGTASYSMMADYHRRGEMDDTQVIVTSIMNSFFQALHHFFSYYIPVVVPLLGLYTGLLYSGIKMGIGLAVTLSAVIIGRIFIKDNGTGISIKVEDHRQETNSEKLDHAILGTRKTLKMIIPRLYIVYTVAVVLLASGYLQRIGDLGEPLARLFGLPGEAITIIALQAVDATAGFVLTGALLDDGTLYPLQAISALLLGTMITLSMTYAKHSLPSKIAFFGPKLGTRIALYNLILHMFFTLLVLGGLVAFSQ